MVVYAIIGFFVFFVLRAMGELLLSNLNYKSFVDFTADLLGPAAAFYLGWSYWFAWVVTGIADLVAITGYARFWWPASPVWLPALLTVGLILTVNLFSVGHFGEMEFWLALIKVVAILSLILLGAFLVVTNFVSPQGDRATIENLWNDGGLFPRASWAWPVASRSRSSPTSVSNSSAPPPAKRLTRAAPFPGRSTPFRCAWRSSTSARWWQSLP
ncbi:hypothetical protein NIIDMKKI_37850 [Mycobacterium kansasii]|uniref:Amino acid permease/ SLC12A domain-containing protein n=1 Tax=Mycobacterium kansasii TaxID=1768 RepID=A0A7G1IG36_MYCKA|nr:hypothetical protein NIIDMKKI_37850 [Mycobacterium kansasii]